MNYQYNYPYNAPQNLTKPKYRAPVFTKIFAILSAVICMIFLLFSTTFGGNSIITNLLISLVWLASSVLLIISTFTGKSILSAIASFLLAFFYILYLCLYIGTYLDYVGMSFALIRSFAFIFLEAILLILIGLHFVLKGKAFNSTAKMIFAIGYGSLELFSRFSSLVSFIQIMQHASDRFIIVEFITILSYLIFSVSVTLILIFFNPYKKPKQPKMPYYNNYNNFNRFNGPYNNSQYNGRV